MTNQFRNWMFIAMVGVVAYLAASVMQPFVSALLWASALTILTAPLYEKVRNGCERGRFKKSAETIAGLVACLVTILVFVLPFVIVLLGISPQAEGVGATDGSSRSIERTLQNLDQQLASVKASVGASSFSLERTWQENQKEIVSGLQAPLVGVLKSLGVTLFSLGIAILAQFFLLRDGWKLKEGALDLIPLEHAQTERLLQRLTDTVWAVFYGTVLVAMLQGGLIGAAYAYVGLPNWLLLTVLSAVMAIIPLLGAPVVYFPVAFLLLFQGKTQEALIILGFGTMFVSNIDNVIKPFLIGGRSNLHPLPIFFSILGGVFFFGPIGVISGPMLLTITLVVIEALREKTKLPDAPETAASE